MEWIIDSDERYPDYYLIDKKEYEKMFDAVASPKYVVSEDLVKRYRAAVEEYAKVQRELEALLEGHE